MRIADHAPALQGSQVLQQPSNTVHQQQIQAPQIAGALAAQQAQQSRSQVNRSNQTDGRMIQEQKERALGGGNQRTKKSRQDAGEDSESDSINKGIQPGSGKILDIVV
jgi:hypothetical protein